MGGEEVVQYKPPLWAKIKRIFSNCFLSLCKSEENLMNFLLSVTTGTRKRKIEQE
jgi:hypothetical protein